MKLEETMISLTTIKTKEIEKGISPQYKIFDLHSENIITVTKTRTKYDMLDV